MTKNIFKDIIKYTTGTVVSINYVHNWRRYLEIEATLHGSSGTQSVAVVFSDVGQISNLNIILNQMTAA